MPALNTNIVKGKFKCQCDFCHKVFEKTVKDIGPFRRNPDKKSFCNNTCRGSYMNKRITKQCKQCKQEFIAEQKEIKKGGGKFCSRSCAATYNNTHKTHGTRRSKLEKYLEEELTKLYPKLEIHFNRKDAINSELDIYIPSLSLAFELNGIFHYEPIYGQDKLASIQNNDNRKFQACLEKDIELCIVDTSQQKYFKEKSSKKYLDIICGIIDTKI